MLGYTDDPDRVILDNIQGVDTAALKDYYESHVVPAPLVWIIVGDRKSLP